MSKVSVQMLAWALALLKRLLPNYTCDSIHTSVAIDWIENSTKEAYKTYKKLLPWKRKSYPEEVCKLYSSFLKVYDAKTMAVSNENIQRTLVEFEMDVMDEPGALVFMYHKDELQCGERMGWTHVLCCVASGNESWVIIGPTTNSILVSSNPLYDLPLYLLNHAKSGYTHARLLYLKNKV